LADPNKLQRFEHAVLPYLDAAYNLARWLTHDPHQAEDVVQEAYLRAFKFFDGHAGGDTRAWLLAIVRNTCYTWLQHNRRPTEMTRFDEQMHGESSEDDPGQAMLREADREMIRDALEELPAEAREVLVLREFEGLSYREIAVVASVPLGTVMSRLTRARRRLVQILTGRQSEEVGRGL
jgi:RNA polymerase sigma-70 factor (ECF subfamily)